MEIDKNTNEDNVDIIKGINVNELKKYYLEENHSQEECAKYFNCSRSTIQRVCNQVNIHKSKASVKNKRDETIKKLYGVDNAFQNEEIKKKIKNTIQKKYGVDNVSQSKGIKEKKKLTCLTNYGVDNPMKIKSVQNEVLQKSKETCMEKYGVPYYILTEECRQALINSSSNSVHSKPNEKYAKFFEENKINFEREFRLGSYSYDFKIGDKLIEINPTATHNVEWSPFGDHKSKINKNYHKEKGNAAKENSYSCMMIWDWDNQTAINNYFAASKDHVYARECEIKMVIEKESKDFLLNYHFQGYAKAKITYGLYYNGELVSIMSFDSPRYNKNYEWEIIRYCSSKSLVGGAEKLFHHFLNDYKPNSIISYCDCSKFRGDTYKKLGFTLLRTSQPSIHWYNLRDKRHFTDNLIRQGGVSRIVNHCEPGEDIIAIEANTTDNYTLMLLNGFLPVYDCGQQSWIWEKKTPLE